MAATRQFVVCCLLGLFVFSTRAAPVFERPTYVGQLREDAAVGSLVQGVTIRASGDGVVYSADGVCVQKDNTVRTTKTFNRESNPRVEIVVTASNSIGETDTAMLVLNIEDFNDNAPIFDLPSYKVKIPEDTPNGTNFLNVTASDLDLGDNARVVYAVENNPLFTMTTVPSGDRYTGLLLVNGRLDYDYLLPSHQYELVISATDSGPSPKSGTATVTVEMENVSDEYPVFEGMDQVVKFRRNAKPNSIVTMVHASDPDGDGVTFEFRDQTASNNMFSIDSVTGLVRLTGNLPADDQTLMINVVATDDGQCCNSPSPTPLSVNDTLKIQIVRTYDNPPVFPNCSSYENVAVEENTPEGTLVVNVTALDSLNTSMVTYGFPDVQLNLAINPTTGEITVKSVIDREQLDQILVTVQAADRGSPPLTGFCTFSIKVSDVNDVTPQFDLIGDIIAFLPINAPAAAYVTCVIANDTDAGPNGQISYSILPGNDAANFAIDNNGVITLAQAVSGSNGQVLTATVMAQDGGSPPRNVNRTLRVTLRDSAVPAWDEAYTTSSYRVNETAQINTDVATVSASISPDEKINYYLVSDSGAFGERDPTGDFSIDLNNGRLRIYQSLNYLRRRAYKLRVQASTGGNLFVETCPTIQVVDTNNQAPEFAQRPPGSGGFFRGLAKENSSISQVIAEVRATDKDTQFPDNQISFALVNSSEPYQPFLTVRNKNNFTGQISTNYLFDYENATNHEFLLGVIAYDGSPSTRPNMNGQANSATVSVRISVINTNDNAPTLRVTTPSVTVREDNALNETIASVMAHDPDVIPNDPDNIDSLSFTITAGNTGNYFGVRSGINERSNVPGEIFLLRHLDFENLNFPDTSVGVKTINLTVQVEDSEPTHTEQASLSIRVVDVNDNAPEWTIAQTKFNITEGATNVTLLQLTATDRDSGVNAQFDFRVDRSTDPGHSFTITSANNLIVSQPLSMERNLKPLLKLLVIDRGVPALTSTATLTLSVVDINDHAPQLTGQYNVQVPENEAMAGRQIATLTAEDEDAAPHADPFTFSCNAAAPSDNACNSFEVETDPSGNGGKGAGLLKVKASGQFDREQRKSFSVPVLIRDNGGMNATSWVTVVIADKNDNAHSNGHQDIHVLNYRNQFGPGAVGRVYCQDRDDWDLPDKTFTYTRDEKTPNYFSVGDYGVVTMQPHVNGSHELSVSVQDRVRGGTAQCTVKVQVAELPKEAPYRAGSARIRGTTAEDFVKTQTTGVYNSKFEAFKGLLAQKLALDRSDVFIVSVTNYDPMTYDVKPEPYTDIHFAARRGEEFYSPQHVESMVVRNLVEFEGLIGLTITMVPIKACPEVGQGCCVTEFPVSATPQVVNGNGTTRVGVTVTSKARLMAEERTSCNPGYCFNGGTCTEGAWDDFTCECLPGFEGPRCQRLSRSFDGTGPLLLAPLPACIDGDLSLEFRTSVADTCLLYNGPVSSRENSMGKLDFISVALVGGEAQVRVSNGFQLEAAVTVAGRTLNDNNWHRLDILRRGQLVWLVVDQCRSSNGSSDSGCRQSGVVPRQHRSLDLYTHLQVGGYWKGDAAYPLGIPTNPFSGCIRNLTHNGQLYDLHVLGESVSPDCSCGATCGCPLGQTGSDCATNITARELGTGSSLLQWRLQPAFITQLNSSPLTFSLSILFRSRDPDGGVLIHVASNQLYLTVRVADGRLRTDYDLGGGRRSLELPRVVANDGQWLGLTVSTEGRGVAMQVQGGEDRYYARSSDPLVPQSRFWTWQSPTVLEVGCRLQQGGGCLAGSNLVQTVVKDVRLAGRSLPLQDSGSNSAAELVVSRDLVPESLPQDCQGDPCQSRQDLRCSPDCSCKARWHSHACGCAPGFMEAGCAVGSGCIPIDDPCRPNPCHNGGTCRFDSAVGVACTCMPNWTGLFCRTPAEKFVAPPATANIGLIVGLVLGLLALLVLIIILIIFLLGRRKTTDDKRVLEVYPDDDIRENVISYDEEGAGEADNAAFDIARLQVGDSEAGLLPPRPDFSKEDTKPLGRAPVPPYDTDDRPTVEDTVRRRLRDADEDPLAPPNDSFIPFNYEGSGSDAGSLSSIESASTDRSQDFDYLNDWGDKFAKLADMYGAGANSPRSPGGDSDL